MSITNHDANPTDTITAFGLTDWLGLKSKPIFIVSTYALH